MTTPKPTTAKDAYKRAFNAPYWKKASLSVLGLLTIWIAVTNPISLLTIPLITSGGYTFIHALFECYEEWVDIKGVK